MSQTPPPKAAEIFRILSVKRRSNSSQGCTAWLILRILVFALFCKRFDYDLHRCGAGWVNLWIAYDLFKNQEVKIS